jgi:hypothetical protein
MTISIITPSYGQLDWLKRGSKKWGGGKGAPVARKMDRETDLSRRRWQIEDGSLGGRLKPMSRVEGSRVEGKENWSRRYRFKPFNATHPGGVSKCSLQVVGH